MLNKIKKLFGFAGKEDAEATQKNEAPQQGCCGGGCNCHGEQKADAGDTAQTTGA